MAETIEQLRKERLETIGVRFAQHMRKMAEREARNYGVSAYDYAESEPEQEWNGEWNDVETEFEWEQRLSTMGEVQKRGDCHCHKISKIPDHISEDRPIVMRFVVSKANEHASEVCAIIACIPTLDAAQMQLPDVWLFTQQELTTFWSKFQNPTNRREYLDFLGKHRMRLPRKDRPALMSCQYDETQEDSIQLIW